jgi:hypothetical protein
MNSIHHPIAIVDTGDNYITCLNDGPIYKAGIALYEAMDLEVKEIATAARATPENLKFIQTWIGRIFNHCVFNDVDMSRRVSTNSTHIVDRLVKDLEAAALFARTSCFWKNMQFTSKTNESVLEDVVGMYPAEMCMWKPIDDALKDSIIVPLIKSTLVIVYNTIYNLSLVVDLPNAKEVCECFPDFVVVQELHSEISESIRISLDSIFHKKSFASANEIQSKYEAFSSLFFTTTTTTLQVVDEKTRIERFILENYTLSSDPDKRLKANDLYKVVINHMCVHFNDVTCFKKRLAGYLVDMCLKKKRFSDAYYFYGIEKNDNNCSGLNATLDERMKQYKINVME